MIVDRFDLAIFEYSMECIMHPCCLIYRNFDVHINVHEHQHLHCIHRYGINTIIIGVPESGGNDASFYQGQA